MFTVAIIGAGPLGRWLALAAARAGFRVLLEDVMPANLHHAQEYIREQLSPAAMAHGFTAYGGAAHGEVTALADGMDFKDEPAFAEETGFLDGAEFHPAAPDANLTGDLPASSDAEAEPKAPFPVEPLAGSGPSPVRFVATIEDAVREADLAIDCVPDELESKLEILWLLDRMAPPRTVLATPTTRLSIVDLAGCTYRPDKCVAIVAEASELTQRANAHILLRTTPLTSAATVELVREFWERLGFTPGFDREAVHALPDPVRPDGTAN